MKKLIFILSALFVFAACGQKQTGESKTDESKTDKDAAKEVVAQAKKVKNTRLKKELFIRNQM